MSRFPAINSKIKEANEGMEDALNETKQHYDKYKSLVMKVKNDYFFLEMQKICKEICNNSHLSGLFSSNSSRCDSIIWCSKRSRNILDFSDYEHFALCILTNEDGSPSRILKRIVNILKKS